MESAYTLFSALPGQQQKRAWAEIDLDALRQNYRLLRATVTAASPTTRMIAVVKGEAYGHGYPHCISTLLEEGCDFFAAATLEEALAVRKICNAQGHKPNVLILGYTDPACAPLLSAHALTQALLSPAYAAALHREAEAASLCLSVHVAVNTGMNRIGFAVRNEAEVEATAREILSLAANSRWKIDGIFTHFARADEENDPDAVSLTDLQMQRFRALRTRLEPTLSVPLWHACNSAAALTRPADHLDAVRLGILLFGSSPLEVPRIPLRPVMKLKTLVAHLHRLLPGEAVGYGGEYVATEERLLATLPIGYADGLPRAATGARVTVHTRSGPRSAPLVGRICMDQCMIDVTDLGADLGNEVTVFGEDPRALATLSRHVGSIDHELLCGISPRVPRIYLDSRNPKFTSKE